MFYKCIFTASLMIVFTLFILQSDAKAEEKMWQVGFETGNQVLYTWYHDPSKNESQTDIQFYSITKDYYQVSLSKQFGISATDEGFVKFSPGYLSFYVGIDTAYHRYEQYDHDHSIYEFSSNPYLGIGMVQKMLVGNIKAEIELKYLHGQIDNAHTLALRSGVAQAHAITGAWDETLLRYKIEHVIQKNLYANIGVDMIWYFSSETYHYSWMSNYDAQFYALFANIFLGFKYMVDDDLSMELNCYPQFLPDKPDTWIYGTNLSVKYYF